MKHLKALILSLGIAVTGAIQLYLIKPYSQYQISQLFYFISPSQAEAWMKYWRMTVLYYFGLYGVLLLWGGGIAMILCFMWEALDSRKVQQQQYP